MQTAKTTRQAVVDRDGKVCAYCGARGLSGRRLNLDHIHPVSKGGANTVDNLVVSCRACNMRKHNSAIKDYAMRRIASLDKERALLLALCRKLGVDPA